MSISILGKGGELGKSTQNRDKRHVKYKIGAVGPKSCETISQNRHFCYLNL